MNVGVGVGVCVCACVCARVCRNDCTLANVCVCACLWTDAFDIPLSFNFPVHL